MNAETDQIIEALTAALLRHVKAPLVPIGTRVSVRSERGHVGTVVGADGVNGEALAVHFDKPYPRYYRDGLCAALVSECSVIPPGKEPS